MKLRLLFVLSLAGLLIPWRSHASSTPEPIQSVEALDSLAEGNPGSVLDADAAHLFFTAAWQNHSQLLGNTLIAHPLIPLLMPFPTQTIGYSLTDHRNSLRLIQRKDIAALGTLEPPRDEAPHVQRMQIRIEDPDSLRQRLAITSQRSQGLEKAAAQGASLVTLHEKAGELFDTDAPLRELVGDLYHENVFAGHIVGPNTIDAVVAKRSDNHRLGSTRAQERREIRNALTRAARIHGRFAVHSKGRFIQVVIVAADPDIAQAVVRLNENNVINVREALPVLHRKLMGARESDEPLDPEYERPLAFLRDKAAFQLALLLKKQSHKRARPYLHGKAAGTRADQQIEHLESLDAALVYDRNGMRFAVPDSPGFLLPEDTQDLLAAVEEAGEDGETHRSLRLVKAFLNYQLIRSETPRQLPTASRLSPERLAQAQALGRSGSIIGAGRVQQVGEDLIQELVNAGWLANLGHGWYLVSGIEPDATPSRASRTRRIMRLINADYYNRSEDASTLIPELAHLVVELARERPKDTRRWAKDWIYFNVMMAFAAHVYKQERQNVDLIGTERQQNKLPAWKDFQWPAFAADRAWVNIEERGPFREGMLRAVQAYRKRIADWNDDPSHDNEVLRALSVLESFLSDTRLWQIRK